jgi:hypothetical protein
MYWQLVAEAVAVLAMRLFLAAVVAAVALLKAGSPYLPRCLWSLPLVPGAPRIVTVLRPHSVPTSAQPAAVRVGETVTEPSPVTEPAVVALPAMVAVGKPLVAVVARVASALMAMSHPGKHRSMSAVVELVAVPEAEASYSAPPQMHISRGTVVLVSTAMAAVVAVHALLATAMSVRAAAVVGMGGTVRARQVQPIPAAVVAAVIKELVALEVPALLLLSGGSRSWG